MRLPSSCTLGLTVLFASAVLASAAISNQVSVKSYGAVGNGVHDDTAAIEAALATLLASIVIGEENQLYFPSGQYLLASTPTDPNGYLSLPPHVNTSYSFVGSGSNTSSLLWTPSNGPVFDLEPHDEGQTQATIFGSTISIIGLTIRWSSSVTQNDVDVANIAWYQQTTFTDVQFQGDQPFDNSITAIEIQGDATGSFLMSDVIATNCGSFIEMSDLGTTSINSTTLSNIQWGVCLDTLGNTMNLQINEMIQTDVAVGVYLQMDGTNDPPPTPTIMNAQITNSHFIVTENMNNFPANEAIIQSSPGLLYVEGCTFDDTIYESRVHIDAVQGAATIVNNEFNSGSSGFFPAGYNTEGSPSASLNVTGNTFTGPWTSPQNVAFETIANKTVIVENNSCTGGSLVYQCASGQTCVQKNNPGCIGTQEQKKAKKMITLL